MATERGPGGVRVGVVGCGYWGPKLVRTFAALPQADLTTACDLDPARLRAIGEQYPGLELTTDFEALLAGDVEAVAIATPVGTHYRLVKQALLAGKHVLVEKPLTSDSRQGAELVRLAAERGLTLMVDHTFLFEPAVERLRDLVRSGELGEIWQISAARLNLGLFRRDANVLWDLAPHDVSILLEVLGTEPTVVSARGACHVRPGIQDVAFIELRFPDKVMAHVHVSWLDPRKVRRMTVVGSRKMAVYDDTAPDKLRVFDRAVSVVDLGNGARELAYRQGDTTVIPLPSVEPLARQSAHFVECVLGHGQPKSDGRQGLRVVRILEQADRSLQGRGHAEPIGWADADGVGRSDERLVG